MKRKFFGLFLSLCMLACLAVPSLAAYAGPAAPYVTDAAGLLSAHELVELEDRARRISEQYQCGLYIVTVDDYRYFNSYDISTFGFELYEAGDMGLGSDRDGVLLVLSMNDRDYNLRAMGQYGQSAFTSYGLDALESAVLDCLGDDDWWGAFDTYLDIGEKYLSMAAEGRPFDADTDPTAIMISAAIVIFVPCLVALCVCTFFKSQMKSVRKQYAATPYMVMESAQLRICEDRFTHRTEYRRKIEKKSSGGSGGGGSSRSGKF